MVFFYQFWFSTIISSSIAFSDNGVLIQVAPQQLKVVQRDLRIHTNTIMIKPPTAAKHPNKKLSENFDVFSILYNILTFY